MIIIIQHLQKKNLSIGFEKAFENDRFILYFDHQYFAVMIEIKTMDMFIHLVHLINLKLMVTFWRRTNSGVILIICHDILIPVVSEGSVLLFANATPELQEDAPVEMNYNLRQSSYRLNKWVSNIVSIHHLKRFTQP